MASVIRAQNLSWTTPYRVRRDKVSVLICRFSSCWQQGTEKIIRAFQETALNRA